MRTMLLVIVAALTAVCGADKLDRVYLPPVSAKTAGGNARSLQAPLFRTFDQGSDGIPSGGYTNDNLGVIVDAVNPGTRASGVDQTGLGGPRSSYGSTNSKVGDAAFRESVAKTDDIVSSRIAPGFESFVTTDDEKTGQANFRIAPGFDNAATSSAEGSLTKDKKSNTLKFNNDVGLDKYSYGYETDNGIAVEEDGVNAHGANAQGGYAFKSDDGKVYEVTYTADEGGYKPQGSHLPTPPPIPHSILFSLEKNAKEEAAGVVDDGSYDAQKYNEGGDYSNSNNGNIYNDRRPSIGDKYTTASGSFGTQNDQPSSFASHGSNNYHSGSQFGASAVSSSSTAQSGQSGQLSKAQAGYKPFGASGTQFGQSGFDTKINTEGRFGTPGFGFQSSFNKENKVQGASSKATFGSPGFSSAFSSASSSGSGSATAFAQTGSGSRSEYPSTQHFASKFQGSDAAVNPTTPSIAIASASATDSPFNTQSQYNGVPQSQASANVEPGQVSSFASTQNVPVNSVASSFGQSLSENSGVSSASPTSATASASVTPQSSTFGSQQQQFGSFQVQQSGRPGQYTAGSGTRYNGLQSQTSKPVQYTQGSGSFLSGANQFGSSFNTPTSTLNVNPASSFSSFNQKPTKVPNTELVTPYEPIKKPSKPSSTFGSSSFNTQTSNQFASGQLPSQYPTQSAFGSTPKPSTSQLGSSSFQSTFFQGSSGQYNNNKFGASNGNPTDAAYSSSTKKPSYQEQGADSSYYYNQPNKPFETPIKPQGTTSTQFSSQISGDRQPNFPINTISQETKYPNTPASVSPTLASQTGQYQTTSFNGITQAEVSSFPSGSSTTSTQFGSKPSVISQSTTQTGTSLLDRRPLVQSQSKPSSTLGQSSVDSAVSTTQEYEGTIYEYNKPAETLPTPNPEQDKPSQVSTGSVFGSQFSQSSSQFGSQSKPSGTFQQTQSSQTAFGSQSTGSFGQKPTTSTFGQKPFGSSQISGHYQQSQFGASTGSQFGHKPSSAGAPLTSAGQPVQFGQIGQKPFGSSFATQNQFSTSQLGSSQSGGSKFPQSQFGSSTGSQFGQKPQTTGSSFTSNKFSQTQAVQTTQFEPKPLGSSQTTGSNFQQSQFGVKPQTGSSFSIGSQSSQSEEKPFDSSQTAGSSFQQTQFGSSTGSQFNQKPTGVQTTVSNFGQKPLGSSQSTSSSFQQTGFGSSSGSQFGQKPQTQGTFGSTTGLIFNQKPQSGSSFSISTVSPLSNQKPFGSSQTSGSNFEQSQFSSTASQLGQITSGELPSTVSTIQQNQATLTGSQSGSKPFGSSTGFGSTTGSQFGQKPQINQGSSFTTSTGSQGQTVQTTQFGQKPFGSSNFQQNQFGAPGSTFGQKPQSTPKPEQKPFGSSQTAGSTFQQSQFGSTYGSQFGTKPTNQGSTLSTASNDQAVQTTQFAQKPFGGSQTGSTFQQSQYGISGSTFGQKPQSIGSGFGTGSQGQTQQAVQKPFGSVQSGGSTQLSSTTGSQVGQSLSSSAQTTGNTFQQNQFGSSTGSQFGQKPTGSSFTTGFQQNHATSSGSQYTQKPQSSFTQSQFDSSTQETHFGTTSGSTFGQKPSTGGSIFSVGSLSQGQSTQTTQKPLGSSQIGSSFQQSQFASNSQTVQTTQFGQKPFGSSQTGSTLQQNQLGTSGSTFGQKPSTPGSGFSISTVSSQADKKPFGTSQTGGSSFQLNQFGSSTGSQFGQKPSSVQTTFGQKPFGSSQTTFQQNQFGSSTGSTSGQKPQITQGSTSTSTDQSVQTTQFGQNTFGSQSTGFGSQQNQLSATTGSQISQKPQTSFGTGFGSSEGQAVQTSQFGQKPFSSQSTGTTFQQTQFGSSTGSSFGQKPSQGTFQSTGTAFASQFPVSSSKPQFGSQTQKPFGGIQSTQVSGFQQTQFGSSGSYSGQKPLANKVQSTGLVFGTQTSQTSQSQFGTQTQKPFGTAFQQNQFGQKPTSSASASASTTGTSSQFGVQPFGSQYNTDSSLPIKKPFGSSQTQQSQFTQSSTHFGQSSQGSQNSFGLQAQKPFGSSSYTQTGGNQPLKPFGSVGTGFQTQFSQSLDQKTQSSQSGILATGAPISSAQSSAQIGQPLKPFGSSGNGYTYQKPVATFSSQFGSQTPRPSVDQKPQPTQASAFASTSKPEFGSQTFKPFGVGSTQSPNYQTTVGSAQFGAQSTDESEYVSNPRPQFNGLPVSSTTAQASFQPTTTLPTLSQFGGQSVKPFGTSQGSSFGQAQSSASSTGFGVQTAQSTAQTNQGSKFGQSFGPTFQTNLGAFGGKPELSGSAQSLLGNLQAGQTLTGAGEQFGGPRDPPKFDDKTGYHY